MNKILVVIFGALLLAATETRAVNPWFRCYALKYTAAGKYAECQGAAVATLARVGIPPDNYQERFAKCVRKYQAMWPLLQARAAMSPCDVSLNPCCASDRFVDNGDGTVTDRLTALQWEKKTNDSTIHDSSNTYSEGTTRGAADGTVFTTFLATLNQNGSCFAQKCDWRLPTVEELQTILLKPYPCDTPCIDENLFGPVGNAWYWSSTPGYPVIGSTLMIVNFIDGTLFGGGGDTPAGARAVRRGM